LSAARILPRDEWWRLKAEDAAFFSTVNPDDVAVVVVEEAGEIVAQMGVLRIPIIEAFRMATEKVGNAGVTRALLGAVREQAMKWAPYWLHAYAGDDAMGKVLLRLGGEPLPVQPFNLPLRRLEEEPECPLS